MINQKDILGFTKRFLELLGIRIALWLKNYDLATKKASAVITMQPNDLLLLELAQEVFKETNNWPAFYEIYDQVEKIHPNKVQIKRNRGTAYLSLFQYNNAIEQFDYCLKNWDLHEPRSLANANTKARLAICYSFLMDWEKALPLLREVESEIKWDVDLTFAQLLYAIWENPSQIIDILDEKIKISPKLYLLHYWKGHYLRYYLHDYEGALNSYETALAKIKPRDLESKLYPYFWSHIVYADPEDVLKDTIDLCVTMGKLQKAKQVLFWSKTRFLGSIINFHVVNIYLDIKMGKFQEAESKAQTFISKRQSPQELTEYWILLARAQLGQGQIEKSLTSIANAIRLDAGSYSAKKILGDIQLRKGDWAAAQVAFLSLIEKNPFAFDTWKKLGLCQLELNDLLSSLSSFERSVQLNRYDAEAWIDIGDINIKLKKIDVALSAFQEGLKYDWLDEERRQRVLRFVNDLK